MRLLQLATGPDELLDLHPNVTVVQGLDDGRRRLLVDAVSGLGKGSNVVGSGLLEAHGVLFELRADLLGLLDLATLDLDPIVRPGDLPTQPLTVDARELRTREEEFAELLRRIAAEVEKQSAARDAVATAAAAVEAARRAHAEAAAHAARRLDDEDEIARRLDQAADDRRRVERDLDELRPALEAAEAAWREVEARTADVRGAVVAARARQAGLVAERDALAADRDPDAAAALERAEAELADVLVAIEAERALDAGEHEPLFAADEGPEVEAPEMRLARAEARLGELDRLLLAVAPVEADPVAEALSLLRGGDSMEQVPSADATALADEIELIAQELGAGEPAESTEGSLTDARDRLDDARQALLEAEQAVRNPELDRDEVRALEDAHADLLDAIDKADSRFAGARARARVIELRDLEQVILDRLGFTSYSAFMMGSSLLHEDPVKEAALDAARAELATAEDDWRRLEQATDEALARAAVLDRRRGLLERARELLGVSLPLEEVPDALRSLRVPVVSTADSACRLRAALQDVGLELGDEDLDHTELALIADAWLAEATAADGRRRSAVEERAALASEVPSLRASVPAQAAAEEVVAPPDPEAARAERAAAARERLADAENRWLAHELAEERWSELIGQLDAATATALDAAAAAAGAEAEVADALASVTQLREAAHGLEEELVAAIAAQEAAGAALGALAAEVRDPAVLDAEITACEARHREAVVDLEAQSRVLDSLDADGQSAAIEIERLQDIVAAEHTGGATEADELEWYLLARLAAQRSVSIAGSLPLLLDDALRGLEAADLDHVLGRLERMGDAVQVIVVSEDPLVARWAQAAGPARAAVVRPSPP